MYLRDLVVPAIPKPMAKRAPLTPRCRPRAVSGGNESGFPSGLEEAILVG